MSPIEHRIERHPVLPPDEGRRVLFSFNGIPAEGVEGEAVSSAVFALGARVFGHHPADGSPQGMFCANGQCSQCTLVIDGIPQKSCIVPLTAGMDVRTLEGLPVLGEGPGPDAAPASLRGTEVLILGAGPSGMAAAIELGRLGIDTVLVDDKDRPGGKLVLQTHKFFGSVEDCYAGTRGIRIAALLEEELRALPSVELWLESIVLGAFSDGTVGIRRGNGFRVVKPRYLLVATGARERSLAFPGCTLPGVYGAGAFQTLVNRDRIRCADRLFVLGGGNVGLIAAYHAMQAGMTVVGLAEAMPRCGGYKVHADKIRRLGVPIHTGHTVLAAHGGERLEAVTIARVDDGFRPVPGTERYYAVDTLLIAVGLDPVDEFHRKAAAFGMRSLLAGDAEEIAEASAAMFTGRMRGLEIAAALGRGGAAPVGLQEKADILKSPGGRILPYEPPDPREGVFPVLHCTQEIPCNPCMTCCPRDLIGTEGHPILGVPEFHGGCTGCSLCVAVCPGLAVTLVDFRKSSDRPVVTIPFELGEWLLRKDMEVAVTGWEGDLLGAGILTRWRTSPAYPSTLLLSIVVDASIASRAAGIRIQDPADLLPLEETLPAPLPDSAIVCRCERVSVGTIREHIRAGVRDLNQLKALTRAGFGACGAKTCGSLIRRLCREEGIPEEDIEPLSERPLFAETPLGWFAGREGDDA